SSEVNGGARSTKRLSTGVPIGCPTWSSIGRCHLQRRRRIPRTAGQPRVLDPRSTFSSALQVKLIGDHGSVYVPREGLYGVATVPGTDLGGATGADSVDNDTVFSFNSDMSDRW